MIDTTLSAESKINQLMITVNKVSWKAVESVLKTFGKSVVKDAKINLNAARRFASRKLVNSVNFELSKLEKIQGRQKQISVRVFADAKSPRNKFGKMFYYGNTIEHGLTKNIGGVKRSSIENWFRAKGLRVKGTQQAKGRKRKKMTIKSVSALIAYKINKSGRFESLGDDGDKYLQYAINKHYQALEQKVFEFVRYEIEKAIKVST